MIHIPADVSKVDTYRQTEIQPNLAAWLERYDGPIWPEYYAERIREVRARFEMSHDVLRHSFFSYHVGAFRSVADAALQGGNSESIVQRDYLRRVTREEGEAFWEIYPS